LGDGGQAFDTADHMFDADSDTGFLGVDKSVYRI
jgi:hypothetical protein